MHCISFHFFFIMKSLWGMKLPWTFVKQKTVWVLTTGLNDKQLYCQLFYLTMNISWENIGKCVWPFILNVSHFTPKKFYLALWESKAMFFYVFSTITICSMVLFRNRGLKLIEILQIITSKFMYEKLDWVLLCFKSIANFVD